MTALDFGTWLSQASQRLGAVTDTPRMDAQRLLAHITGRDLTFIVAHSETQLTPLELKTGEHRLSLLENGTPLAYVLGEWEFYGLKFRMTPDILIPRPETELLVQTALGWLMEHPTADAVADVGCGSGCIGISLAVHSPQITVHALDISPHALEITQQNSSLHGVARRVLTRQQDLLTDDNDRYDVICANLPYIATSDLEHLEVARHEPALALDGGEDGLSLIRRLINQVNCHINVPGLALFEIEYRQADASQEIARQTLPKAKIEVKNDLAGLSRLLVIELE